MQRLIKGITSAVLAAITFLAYKSIALQMEKERKIAEELLMMDNKEELLGKRIKYNKKRMILIMLGFYLCLGLIAFITAILILHKINASS